MQSDDKNITSSGDIQTNPESQLIHDVETPNNLTAESTSRLPNTLKVNELATLTGLNRKLVGERLTAAGLPFVEGERNSKLYVVKDALPIIFQASGHSKDITKLDAEKLRQLTAKATLAEITLAEKQQELIPIDDIISIVNDEYTTVKNILTQLPSALATKLSVETDSRVIADLIEDVVQDALSNLKLTSEEALKSQITPITQHNIPETTEDNE